jgi:hypothetical protein
MTKEGAKPLSIESLVHSRLRPIFPGEYRIPYQSREYKQSRRAYMHNIGVKTCISLLSFKNGIKNSILLICQSRKGIKRFSLTGPTCRQK